MCDYVHLQMAGQDDNIKLSWGGSFAKTYCVSQKSVSEAAQAVRAVLRQIADDYISRDASYARYLPKLTEAGEDLRFALFNPIGGANVDNIVDYLKSLEHGTALTISSDSSVQVPWNFVCWDDKEKKAPARNDISDFDPFWVSRFKIRIRFHQTEAPPRPIRRSGFKTLFALHQKRFRDATSVLSQDASLVAKIERLLEHRLGPTADWEDCLEKWETILDEDSVLYIFAHSDGDSLLLEEPEEFDRADSDRYEMTPTRFQRRFTKGHRSSASNTLCFINGCRTAGGEYSDGFLSVTSGPGFHGFIGSEAEISNDWATRYAIEFLYALVEDGKSVDEAYEHTRTLCFPMSLWYSCYAQPGFRVL
jgi:hypothetical protein